MKLSLVKVLVRHSHRKYRALGLSQEIQELENGARIQYWAPKKEKHRGKPSLLLIHGFAADGTLGWINQVPDLAKHFALVVPDLVFFGNSFADAPDWTEIFQAQCMLLLLQRLKIEQASVVGTGYGGIVAYHLADLAPLLIRKVVIASSGVCMTPSSNDRLLRQFYAMHIADIFLPRDISVIKEGINSALYKPLKFIPDFLVRDFENVFGGYRNRGEKCELLNEMVTGTKNAPPLPVISQEVLILWGDSDRVSDVELAHKLHEHLLGRARLEIIPRTGHVPQIERPKKFNKHVIAFLNGGK